MTNYAGIDYGLGQSNINTETGIRYGVIHPNKLSEWVWDTIEQGADVDFLAARQDVLDAIQMVLDHDELDGYEYSEGEPSEDRIKDALVKALDDYHHNAKRLVDQLDLDNTTLADNILDDLEDAGLWDCYESSGDCTRYEYEDGGYHIQTCSDGDWFVLKSPYYTRAQFCSPCAPGAGYLANPCPTGPKTYCLDKEWFGDDQPCPYPYYSVETDELIYSPEANWL